MTLSASEFLRRYVQHVLPHGFVRIRQFGFLANRHRSGSLALIRQLLSSEPQPQEPFVTASCEAKWQCPRCGNLMQTGCRLTARESTFYANGLILPKPVAITIRSIPCLPARSQSCVSRPIIPTSCTVAIASSRLPSDSGLVRTLPKPHSGVHRSSSRVLEQYQKTFEPPYSSRPASGFLLVSFSKVTRHLLRLFAPTLLAESLPNNANDYSLVIRSVPGRSIAVIADKHCCPAGEIEQRFGKGYPASGPQ